MSTIGKFIKMKHRLVVALGAERLERMEVKVAQLCLTLCDPVDCPLNSPGQNTGVDSLSHLQGIFPT